MFARVRENDRVRHGVHREQNSADAPSVRSIFTRRDRSYRHARKRQQSSFPVETGETCETDVSDAVFRAVAEEYAFVFVFRARVAHRRAHRVERDRFSVGYRGSISRVTERVLLGFCARRGRRVEAFELVFAKVGRVRARVRRDGRARHALAGMLRKSRGYVGQDGRGADGARGERFRRGAKVEREISRERR